MDLRTRQRGLRGSFYYSVFWCVLSVVLYIAGARHPWMLIIGLVNGTIALLFHRALNELETAHPELTRPGTGPKGPNNAA